jgi:uncharacterized protein DUF4276
VMIQPIVEGHGEVSAVPELIRKLSYSMAVYDVVVGTPIRRPRSKLMKKETLEQAVTLAKIQRGCGAIIVLFDADDDCPKEVAPFLNEWAANAARPLNCAVVLANREFEGWFLSCVESLRNCRGISNTAGSEENHESIRDAKGRLEEKMLAGEKYIETADQVALTAVADWTEVYRKSRSFRKFTKETRRLLEAINLGPAAWPPNGV